MQTGQAAEFPSHFLVYIKIKQILISFERTRGNKACLLPENFHQFICQAAADDVRRAKQNLEAMRTRLNSDTINLRTANANLEAARAEKELADIAV